MKAREFAYWLQGYFEISGHETPAVVPAQVEIISKKLDTVELTSGEDQINEMIGYIKSKLEILKYLAEPNNQMNQVLYHEIGISVAKKLDDVFLHAIDPSAKNDQKSKPPKGGNTGIVAC